MRKLVMLCALMAPFMAEAQDRSMRKMLPKLELTGFVRSDLIVNSRQNVEALEGAYTTLPKDEMLDANGKDINAAGSARVLGIMSRLGFKATGPQVWGANMTGYIEIDVAGGVGNGATNEVRFRHAWIKMQWEKTQLLTGRSWHPMFTESIFPTVLNLSTGLPYQAFARSPQIRVTHQLSPQFSFLAAAIYQSQYENAGPEAGNPTVSVFSPSYQRNAMIPNLDAQLLYKNEHWLLGAGYDLLTLKPTLYTVGQNAAQYKSTTLLWSNRAFAFMQAKYGALTVNVKGIWGQNLSDQLMSGGYAAYAVDEVTGAMKYTNSSVASTYIQARYKYDQFTFGLFGGYYKNLGFTKDPLQDYVYARSANVDHSWRVTPNVYYRMGKYQLAFEYELTQAAYGTVDYADLGKVKDTHNVYNHRAMVSAFYFF